MEVEKMLESKMTDEHVKFTLPAGYHRLHDDLTINFNLNRGISLGYARYEDMAEVAPKIGNDFEKWIEAMTGLAEQALAEDRVINAAFYYRLAEFFMFEPDPRKKVFYDKFRKLTRVIKTKNRYFDFHFNIRCQGNQVGVIQEAGFFMYR